jgi:hypothetical protein
MVPRRESQLSDDSLLRPRVATSLFSEAAVVLGVGVCLEKMDPLRQVAGGVSRGAGQ